MANEIDRLLAKLERAQARTARRVEKGLIKAAEQLLAASLELCPIDPDTPDGQHVYDSGHVKKRQDQGGTAYGVSYGIIQSRPRAAKANPLYLHENINLRHGMVYNLFYMHDIAIGTKKDRRPQEQANFLRQPEEQMRGDMRDTIKEEAKR